jgi:hypothetical protein
MTLLLLLLLLLLVVLPLQFDENCRPFYPTGFNAFELTTMAASEWHIPAALADT